MNKIGATNEKPAANEIPAKLGKIRHYADERIDVSYDATRCIHAAECVHRLPAVFDTARRPWILPSGAGADAIAAVVARCPTGALHATRLDGGPAEDVPVENVIVPMPNGPLYVRGQLHLRSPEVDVTIDDVRMALCRCGQSRNKPFCDNSHREAGFRDPGAIPGAMSTAAGAGTAKSASTAAASANAGSGGSADTSASANAAARSEVLAEASDTATAASKCTTSQRSEA